MTKTLEEIEAQLAADVWRDEAKRHERRAAKNLSFAARQKIECDAALRHAERRIQELKQAIADNRSANHMNEQFPHDYAVSIMKHLSEIALDLRSRKGSD